MNTSKLNGIDKRFWLILAMAAGLPVSVFAQPTRTASAAPSPQSQPGVLYWWGGPVGDWSEPESWGPSRRPPSPRTASSQSRVTFLPDRTTLVVVEEPLKKDQGQPSGRFPPPVAGPAPEAHAGDPVIIMVDADANARRLERKTSVVLQGGQLTLSEGLTAAPNGDLQLEGGSKLVMPGDNLEAGTIRVKEGELHFKSGFHLGTPDGLMVEVERSGLISATTATISGGITFSGGKLAVDSLWWFAMKPRDQGSQSGNVESKVLWYAPQFQPELWESGSPRPDFDRIEFKATRAIVSPLHTLSDFVLPSSFIADRVTFAISTPQSLRGSLQQVGHVDVWPSGEGASLVIASKQSSQLPDDGRLSADGRLGVVGGSLNAPALRIAGGSVECDAAILDRAVVEIGSHPEMPGARGTLSARSEVLVHGSVVQLDGGSITTSNLRLVSIDESQLNAPPLVDPALANVGLAPKVAGAQDLRAEDRSSSIGDDLGQETPPADEGQEILQDALGSDFSRSVSARTAEWIAKLDSLMPKDASHADRPTNGSSSPTDWNLPSPTDWNLPSPTDFNLPSPTDWNLPSPTDFNLPSPTDWNLPNPNDWNLPSPNDWQSPAPSTQSDPAEIAGDPLDFDGSSALRASLAIIRQGVAFQRQRQSVELLGSEPTEHPDYGAVQQIWLKQDELLGQLDQLASRDVSPSDEHVLELFSALHELDSQLSSIEAVPDDTVAERDAHEQFLESERGGRIMDALRPFEAAAKRATNAASESESRAAWNVADARMKKFMAAHPEVSSGETSVTVAAARTVAQTPMETYLLQQATDLLPPPGSIAGLMVNESGRYGGVLSGYGTVNGIVTNNGTIDLRDRLSTTETTSSNGRSDTVTVTSSAVQLKVESLQQGEDGTVLIMLDDFMRPFLHVDDSERAFKASDVVLAPLAVHGDIIFDADTSRVTGGSGAAFDVTVPPDMKIEPGDTFAMLTTEGHINKRPSRSHWPRIQTADGMHPADGTLFWGLDIDRAHGCPEPKTEGVTESYTEGVTQRVDLLALKTPGRLVRRDGAWHTEPLGNLATPMRAPLKKGLVIITHGTGSFVPLDGPECLEGSLGGLAKEMAQFAADKGLSDRWDVAVFDWSEFATGVRDRRGYNIPLTPANIVRQVVAIGKPLADISDYVALFGVWQAHAGRALLLQLTKWYLDKTIEDAVEDASSEAAENIVLALIEEGGWTSALAEVNTGLRPVEAARIGRGIGHSLADWLLDSGIDYSQLEHVHLLGHSSGSWVINGFAERMNERRLEGGADGTGLPAITLTFFDAFTGASYVCPSEVPELGTSLGDSTRMEHYVDGRLTGTAGDIANAANVDITWLDPDLEFIFDPGPVYDPIWFSNRPGDPGKWPGRVGRIPGYEDWVPNPVDLVRNHNQSHPSDVFRFDPMGLETQRGMLESFTMIVESHSWPYEWYRRTVDWARSEGMGPSQQQSWWDDDDSWRDWGFVRSPMYQDWLRSGLSGPDFQNDPLPPLPQLSTHGRIILPLHVSP
jgi:hypothetical protein